MITLEPLRADQYKQVAEWDHGPQPPDTDWPAYHAEMNEPQWLHFGMYLHGEFVGCLSLEKIDQTTVEYHVTTARKKIHPQALADLLLATAAYLLREGFTRLTVSVPKKNRAAVRLALRCGMVEDGADETNRKFVFTEKEYQCVQANQKPSKRRFSKPTPSRRSQSPARRKRKPSSTFR